MFSAVDKHSISQGQEFYSHVETVFALRGDQEGRGRHSEQNTTSGQTQPGGTNLLALSFGGSVLRVVDVSVLVWVPPKQTLR